MRNLRPLLAAALVTAGLVGAACDVPESDGVHVESGDKVPYGLLTPSTTVQPTTTTAPVVAANVTICLYRDTQLVEVRRTAKTGGIQSALDLLKLAVEENERTEGLTTALFDPSVVAGVTPRGGVAVVDLAAPFTAVGPPDQLRIIAQLVCTMTAQPGVGQAAFTLGGTPVDVPRGDGSLTSGAVSRDDYAGLIAPRA